MGRRCIGLRCYVLEKKDIINTVNTAVSKLGGVNILVNNSGIGHGDVQLGDTHRDLIEQPFDTKISCLIEIHERCADSKLLFWNRGIVFNETVLISIFFSYACFHD